MTKVNKLKFSPTPDTTNLKNATLILPSISVGNIGQLSIDILLASLKTQRLAACHHPSLIPLVGSNPLDAKSTELMTACELYISEKDARMECDQNIVLMQIRSAIAQNKSGEFLDDLLSWCNHVGIQNGKWSFWLPTLVKINIAPHWTLHIIPDIVNTIIMFFVFDFQ